MGGGKALNREKIGAVKMTVEKRVSEKLFVDIGSRLGHEFCTKKREDAVAGVKCGYLSRGVSAVPQNLP
jgi:hypothetical protein